MRCQKHLIPDRLDEDRICGGTRGYRAAGSEEYKVMELLSLSAVELGKAIKEGRTTAVEAMEAVLSQIEKSEEVLHCYITINKKKALNKAAEVQRRIDAKELTGPLAGVPMAVKDNLCTEGMLTTCASAILANYVPTYSAEAVSRLEKAGAVIVGKTNMDEFAMGSTTETSAYGVTRNPHHREHVPGGSSGGSAAAVAAGECFFALGSDTGGSIRQPASHCGVVGMKPTYGTVSRYGLVAYGSSLDQVGPLCKTVEDCAVILQTIAVPGCDTDCKGGHGFYFCAEKRCEGDADWHTRGLYRAKPPEAWGSKFKGAWGGKLPGIFPRGKGHWN